MPERELEMLKAGRSVSARALFTFAFYMDRRKEERERGVTIACATKELYTEKWHCPIIDAPGHRDFILSLVFYIDFGGIALPMLLASFAYWGIGPRPTEGVQAAATLGVLSPTQVIWFTESS